MFWERRFPWIGGGVFRCSVRGQESLGLGSLLLLFGGHETPSHSLCCSPALGSPPAAYLLTESLPGYLLHHFQSLYSCLAEKNRKNLGHTIFSEPQVHTLFKLTLYV